MNQISANNWKEFLSCDKYLSLGYFTTCVPKDTTRFVWEVNIGLPAAQQTTVLGLYLFCALSLAFLFSVLCTPAGCVNTACCSTLKSYLHTRIYYIDAMAFLFLALGVTCLVLSKARYERVKEAPVHTNTTFTARDIGRLAILLIITIALVIAMPTTIEAEPAPPRPQPPVTTDVVSGAAPGSTVSAEVGGTLTIAVRALQVLATDSA